MTIGAKSNFQGALEAQWFEFLFNDGTFKALPKLAFDHYDIVKEAFGLLCIAGKVIDQ